MLFALLSRFFRWGQGLAPCAHLENVVLFEINKASVCVCVCGWMECVMKS